MQKLDNDWLVSLGLAELPAASKNKLLRHAYETLEQRVGRTLAEQMTDSQLDDFEGFINRKDDAGALHWLETNHPNYREVVATTFEALTAEIRSVAPQILAAG